MKDYTHKKVILPNLTDFYTMEQNKTGPKIDHLLIKTILTLNNKGYKTMFCCSGHFSPDKTTEEWVSFDCPNRNQVLADLSKQMKKLTTGYICFAKGYAPLKVDLCKYRIPRFVSISDSSNVKDCDILGLQWDIPNPTYRKIKTTCYQIYKWVNKLPKR